MSERISVKEMLKRPAEKSYAEKLKDPRWQKKRLEILQRDNFTCRACEDSSKMLHVHHVFYEKGNDPWDYQNNDLITLCEDCHEAWHYIYNGKYCFSRISLIVTLAQNIERDNTI
jgi:5-methylcytosine-specific restriction endonuclease McrA